jgi:hypothetical protein
MKETPAAALAPGKYKVHYDDVAWQTNQPIGPGLVTPRIELEIAADPPRRGKPRSDPEAMAVAEVLKRLAGTWNKATLEIDGRPNARFVNIEPYYVFDGDQFSITDHYGNVEKKGTINIAPSESTMDLHITHGPDKGAISNQGRAGR